MTDGKLSTRQEPLKNVNRVNSRKVRVLRLTGFRVQTQIVELGITRFVLT